MAWFLWVEVPVFEASLQARLEVSERIYRVDVPMSGRVVAAHLSLDRRVEEGELLLELDTEALRLQIAEERVVIATLEEEVLFIEKEIVAEEEALKRTQEANSFALEEAQALQQESAVVRALDEEEANRSAKLRAQGHVTELEYLRAKAELEKQTWTLEARRIQAVRVRKDWARDDADRRARIESLRRRKVEINGERRRLEVTCARLEVEVEKHNIRAPIAGRIGSLRHLRAGALVSAEETVATLVPEGGVRIVAMFAPAAALGRIQPGQVGFLRLDGFPWTQFGTVVGRVTAVGRETDDGRVQVELSVEKSVTTQVELIPVEHGLPGVLEVEVERVSPATLVLRTAGKRLSAPLQKPRGGKETES